MLVAQLLLVFDTRFPLTFILAQLLSRTLFLHATIDNFTMSDRIFECKYCNHLPFTSRKNLTLHLRNSKKCSEKEQNRPKPAARKHDLDNPEVYGSDDDEPSGANGDFDDVMPLPGQLSPMLAEMFAQFAAAVEGLADDDVPEPIVPPPPNSVSVPASDEKPWIQDFPRPTGQTYGRGVTKFEEIQESESKKDRGEWGPFASEKEWDVGKWLFKNVNLTKTNEFLKLDAVSS